MVVDIDAFDVHQSMVVRTSLRDHVLDLQSQRSAGPEAGTENVTSKDAGLPELTPRQLHVSLQHEWYA
eukprot:gene20964-27819_t